MNTRRPKGSRETTIRRLAQLSWLALILLIVQNLLGMDLNLFVALPAAQAFDAVVGSVPVLLAHVVTGLALLVIGGILVAYAVAARNARLIATSAANLAFVLLAIFFGVSFVIAGEDDVLSLLMETAFLGAVACVVVVLVLTAREPVSGVASAGAPRAGTPSPDERG